MEAIKLSDKFTIYKGSDSSFTSKKEECLRIVEINKKYSNPTNDNSIWMEVNSKIFREINSTIHKGIEQISNRTLENYAEHYWVYTQFKGFDLEWMHQHLYVHPSGRTTTVSDYTFTYYLQIPDDMKGDEGHIIFETEDKVKHKFLPKEGDYFIFPGDIRHTGVPTPNCEVERIVYAGSICVDVFNQASYEKSAI